MSKRIWFYVTGHGHGHARRSAELIRALTELSSQFEVTFRTHAPAEIFEGIPRTMAVRTAPGFDPGAMEQDLLSVDPEATLAALKATLRSAERFVVRESALARAQKVSLILTDISFLAAEVAARAGLPCVGFSNFTWDWIYEGWLAEDPEGPEMLRRLHRFYSKINLFLKLPFGHPLDLPAKIIESPLVAQRSARPVAEILGACQLPAGIRFKIVVGLRSGVSAKAVKRAAMEGGDCLFFCPGPREKDWPDNLRVFADLPRVSFPDLLRIADAVVAKLGYGILADTIAASSRLLYPHRFNFREDEITEKSAGQYLPLRSISRERFLAGLWREDLGKLLASRGETQPISTDGARFCAEKLLEFI